MQAKGKGQPLSARTSQTSTTLIDLLGERRVQMRRNPGTAKLIGLGFGIFILLAMVASSFVLPFAFNPLQPDPLAMLQPPSATHWMGTDGSGFDVFSRVMYSARLDIPLAVAGVLVSLLIGVPIGLIAGGRSRWTEWMMRAVEVFQAFPLIVLAIVIVQVTGNHLENVVVALAIVNVPRFIRLVRAEVLAIRESRFVEAAHAIGAGSGRITFRHILPNVPGIILVQSSLAAANGIIVIASLNFIGLGTNPPIPNWGSMIQQGSQYIPQGAWWVAIFPGLATLVAIIAFNLIADNLEFLLGVGKK